MVPTSPNNILFYSKLAIWYIDTIHESFKIFYLNQFIQVKINISWNNQNKHEVIEIYTKNVHKHVWCVIEYIYKYICIFKNFEPMACLFIVLANWLLK